jgi:hypothetical protein
LPDWAQRLFATVERAEGGVQALGAASQGRLEFLLGPWSAVAAKARERLDKASLATQELRVYMKEASSTHSLHLAWLVLSQSIAQALTYDCRLVPPAVLRPFGEQLDSVLKNTIADIAGHALDDSHWEQVNLPGPLSGCAVLSSVRRSPAAYVTTWLQLRGRLTNLVTAFGRPASFVRQDFEVAKAIEELKLQGTVVTDTLQVHFEASANALYNVSPFSADVTAGDLPRNSQDFDIP